MKADVSRKIVMDVGCFLIVRLMGAKIRGIFRTCKMFNKNILELGFLYRYVIDNQSNIFVV